VAAGELNNLIGLGYTQPIMAKHRVVTTDAEIDAAIVRAAAIADEPRAVRVEYRSGRGLDLVILQMSDGHRCVFPREDLQGLQDATKEQLSGIEILGGGTGLHWPELDVQLYIPALLSGVYGTRRWMSELGRAGGSKTSVAKRRSSRANGRKGGRPTKLGIRSAV
jgi:hypothetical protein